MIVLGVDPGSRTTGYGVVRSNGQQHQCLTYGCIRRPAEIDLPQALRKIYEELSSIVAEYQPEAVAVESLFHAANVKSALTLGHARGIVLLCAAVHNLSLHEYSPLEIKKSLAGYGRAEKSQLQEMAKLLLNLKSIPEPHDASDALAVAICHIHQQGFRARLAAATRVSR